MKVDKIMETAFRILAGITAIMVIVGFCVSCVGRPVIACADIGLPDWAFPYQQFTQTYDEKLKEIQESNGTLATILNDDNISADDKKQALLINALNTFDYKFAVEIFMNWENENFQNVPDTVDVSMVGGSGLCKRSGSDDLHVVNFYPGTANIASSDFFNLVVSTTWDGDANFRPAEWYSGSDLYGVRLTTARDYRVLVADTMGYFSSSYNQPVYTNTYELYCYGGLDRVPTVSGSLNNYFATGSAINSALAGLAVNVSLPNASVNSSTPWEYYNNILLPYIHNNFNNLSFDIDSILAFPNGYYPSPTPDPTEPATFPNGGIYIDKQYNIGINVIYPTDASGQPVTDASGETVTETEYITDTSPFDGEYSFLMPTLPRLTVFDSTLPNPDLSAYSEGIGFIWNACYNILSASGLMPVVMICLSLALLGFVLWKLGG